jgi:IS5 family transposase
VLFGTTPAATVTYVSPFEVVVTTPAMPDGSVDLVVVNHAGDEVRVADGFYFGTPPRDRRRERGRRPRAGHAAGATCLAVAPQARRRKADALRTPG